MGENLIRVLKDDACIKIVNPDSLCSVTHLQSMQETHTDRIGEEIRTRTEIVEPVASTSAEIVEEVVSEETIPITDCCKKGSSYRRGKGR